MRPYFYQESGFQVSIDQPAIERSAGNRNKFHERGR